ncbi:DUF6731 family protein [Aquabacterium sp.]|uniref:DUF6731 family protein n=1 Tax=Aquabacterium sp. TaxID=1872578 RepID=UPI003783B6ED
MAKRSKAYKVDFFVVTDDDDPQNTVLFDLLNGIELTDALPLEAGEEEKYQIRSVQRMPGGGQAFKAVFGRCRFGERPVQGAEDGKEEDVELKPGHGLVEKNHFLFFGRRNLVVYQRNPGGSHYSRFQRYLRQVTHRNVTLAPILTSDAYERVLSGGDARILDISFQQPRDPTFYADTTTADAIALVKKVGALNCRMRFSVGRTRARLMGKMKDAAVILARHGLARVARVTLEDEKEPIDLIADRIIETISVRLQDNGRPDPEDLYAALNEAMDKRRDDLARFFGS